MNSLLESYQAKLVAPFGVLGIRTIGERLTAIEYLPRAVATLQPRTAFAREVCRQLSAYLKKRSFEFDRPLDYAGTDFQTRVLKAMRAISPESVLSYREVAKRIRSAPRPAGTACGANLIAILIFCHRVVSSQGIRGFMNARRGAPIVVKPWLLHHEKAGAH